MMGIPADTLEGEFETAQECLVNLSILKGHLELLQASDSAACGIARVLCVHDVHARGRRWWWWWWWCGGLVEHAAVAVAARPCAARAVLTLAHRTTHRAQRTLRAGFFPVHVR